MHIYNQSNSINFKKFITCPATAKPSASKEVASQTCKQTWNAAIDVEPCLAANDAASVTQDVEAMTLINNKDPEFNHEKQSGFTVLN